MWPSRTPGAPVRGGSGHTGRTEWCGGMWAWRDAAQVYKDVLLDVTSSGTPLSPPLLQPLDSGTGHREADGQGAPCRVTTL